MNPIISVSTNDNNEVLLNINSIAAVWSQGNGITVIKMVTFTAANTHDIIYTHESVYSLNAKIKVAFNS